MPVPRIFQSPSDPVARWAHVVASVLALSGPETRSALVAELAGEDLPNAGVAQVRERRPLAGGVVIADVVMTDPDHGWVLALQATLAFDADIEGRLAATHEHLAGLGERRIVVAITPDRAPTAAVLAAARGADVRHKRWQRVRDWIQERPERGQAQGVDLLLLREADYVLNAWTAELYRLEELMPLVPEPLRDTFAGAYLDLDDAHSAPRVTGSGGDWVVGAPRTGEASLEIALSGGGLAVRVRDPAPIPGASPAPDGWQTLVIDRPEAYVAARSTIRDAARRLLPPRR